MNEYILVQKSQITIESLEAKKFIRYVMKLRMVFCNYHTFLKYLKTVFKTTNSMFNEKSNNDDEISKYDLFDAEKFQSS